MAEQAPAERRLAAIVFSDIVGYTSLTERDEARAIRARERHRALARPLVVEFQGEIVDATGDELLCVFPSALLAVDYALAMQAVLRDDADLRLRMGVHLGDVVRRDGEVIGEGVNVAARIRPLAEPGGICVSEPVHRMVHGQPHIRARSLGRQALKNVESSLEVFALDAGARGEPNAWWKRPAVRVLAGFAITLALGYAIYVPNRGAILASVALNLPKLVGAPIEQKLGFATTSDGVRIAYATTGEGPPLVFVLGWATHLQDGMGSPLYDASGFIVHFSEHGTLVRYDGRGFGMSDRDVSDFSLDARVRDLEAVVDALGLRRFPIFAPSAGGPTAIAYAARHPERVSALILAGTNPGSHWTWTPEQRRVIEDLNATIRSGWELAAVRAMVVEIVAPNADEVTKRLMNEFLRRSGSGPAVAGFTKQTALVIDTRDLARRLEVPTLVIHGTRDAPIPIEGGRELASLIPGARFEVLQGADHMEDTGGSPRVHELIDAFLREQGADAPAGG